MHTRVKHVLNPRCSPDDEPVRHPEVLSCPHPFLPRLQQSAFGPVDALPSLELCLNEILQYVLLLVWLPSLSVIILGSFDAWRVLGSVPLCGCRVCSFVCLLERVECFQFLTVTKKAAVNIRVQVVVATHGFISLDGYLGVEWLHHIFVLVFNF